MSPTGQYAVAGNTIILTMYADQNVTLTAVTVAGNPVIISQTTSTTFSVSTVISVGVVQGILVYSVTFQDSLGDILSFSGNKSSIIVGMLF